MSENVLKNPNIKNISFKKPEKISKKIHIFNVRYLKNSRFIIQTPKFLVPYLPMMYLHKNIKFFKLCLEAHNYDYNDSSKKFVKLIQDIDKYVKSKSEILWKKCGYSPKKKNYISSVNFNKNRNKVYFYFSLQVHNNNPEVSIFDWKKNKKDYNYISPQSTAYSLIWLKNVWLKTRKIGLNWVILQMKVYLPIYKIDECLIVDEDEIENKSKEDKKDNNDNNNDNNIEDMTKHPIYGKFFKMKKFGIPISCIQQKLKLENLDPTIILEEKKISKLQNTKNKNNSSKNKHVGGLMSVLSGLVSVKLKVCL